MKLIVTVDITPGSARRLAIVAATLLVTGIAAVAVAVPVTFQSKQRLTAEDLNKNFSDLESKIAALDSKIAASAGPIMTDWRPYSPTLTTDTHKAVIGQTTTGYYRRVGDSVEIVLSTSFSQKPSSGAKLFWQWGLPSGLSIDSTRTFAPGYGVVGSGMAQQPGANNSALAVYPRGQNSVAALGSGSPSPYVLDDAPLAFDAQSTIALHFTVPIAGWTSSVN